MSGRKRRNWRRPLFMLTVGCAAGFGIASWQNLLAPYRLIWFGLSLICWTGALFLLASLYPWKKGT